MKLQVTVNLRSVKRLHQKCRGRIFVHKQSDIIKVTKILKRVDEFEYDYLPNDFIAVYKPEGGNQLIYTHKFDPDIEKLEQACGAEGIEIVVYSTNLGAQEYDIDLDAHISNIINAEYDDEY